MVASTVVTTSAGHQYTRVEYSITELNTIKNMRKEGVSVAAIAKVLGRSTASLQNFCNKHDIRGPVRERRKLTKDQQALAIHMWSKGVTKRSIAKHFSVAMSTIQNIPGMPARKHGEKVNKAQNIPVAFAPSVKRRLDAMSKTTGITRTRIIREAVRREIARWETEQVLGADMRDYGA